MKAKKPNLLNWLSRAFLFIVMWVILIGWIKLRDFSINYQDILWIVVGVFSFLWIILWVKMAYKPNHSLFVPYLPIFLVPLLGGVANKLGLLTSFAFANLILLFYCGYMMTLLIVISVGGASTWLPTKKR